VYECMCICGLLLASLPVTVPPGSSSWPGSHKPIPLRVQWIGLWI
jgi:hypothetical protein